MLKITLTSLLALITSALAVDTDANSTLDDQLLLAPTMLDRWNILTSADGNQWKYDFADNPQYQYRTSPGSVCNANAATWPALTGLGITVAQLNLGPCSMLPPHEHREHNMVIGIQGVTHTMMVQENGAGVIEQDIGPGQATIFPRSSLHTMVNNASLLKFFTGCTSNQLYSFLPGADPGTVNIMNGMMQFGPDVGQIIMPWMANCSDVQSAGWNATSAQVPPIGSGSNAWTQECLTRCNIAAPGMASRRFVTY